MIKEYDNNPGVLCTIVKSKRSDGKMQFWFKKFGTLVAVVSFVNCLSRGRYLTSIST